MTTVACALIPRLELRSAIGEGRELLGKPVALGPEPGGPQVLGEASGAAEAFGVRAGMRLAEALSRCPALVLVDARPGARGGRLGAVAAAAGGDRRGGRALAARRGVLRHRAAARPLRRARGRPGAGAAVAGGARAAGRWPEPAQRPRRGDADARPPPATGRLRGGGAAAARRPARERAARAAGEPQAGGRPAARRPGHARCAGGGGRLHRRARATRACEPWASSRRCPPRRSPTASASRGCGRCDWRAAATSRCGPGARTRRSSAGWGCPRPRRASSSPARSGCWSSGCSPTPPAGEGRSAGCGSRPGSPARAGWRSEVTLRSAAVDPERLRLALAPRLAELPGPAAWLGLRALELGPEPGEQQTLARSPDEERRGRLAEAVRQARSAGGRDAVLRVVEVDSGRGSPSAARS